MNWDWFTAPMLLSLIGAVPGAVRGWALGKKQSCWRGLSDALVGLVFAAAVADWLTPKDKPTVSLLIGLIAGATGARALDAVGDLAPDFVRDIGLAWARKVIGLPPASTVAVSRADAAHTDAAPTVQPTETREEQEHAD